MPYQATVFQVMIASPGDVAKERQIIKKILQEWNYIHSYDKHIALMPIGWETHSAPLMGERPQAIINKQILEDSDLLIAVFWTRIGTPTGEAISGTVEEIERHISSGKPTMLYFSTAPAHPDSIDPEQYNQVKAFKGKCVSEGLVETYDNLSEFKEKLVRQLAITLNKNEYIRNKLAEHGDKNFNNQSELIVGDNISHPEIPTLSEEAKVLIIEASQDNKGNRRSEAAWEAAVDQLENFGFLEDRAMKGEVFFITHEGYQVADYLQQSC